MSSSVSNFSSVFVHSGNILPVNEISSKTELSTSEEMLLSIKHALKEGEWKIENEDHLTVKAPMSILRVLQEHQGNLLTSVKIFWNEGTPEELGAAIEQVLGLLQPLKVDSLILSCPPADGVESAPEQVPPRILALWPTIGLFKKSGEIPQIGVSDLSSSAFGELCVAEAGKPDIHQIASSKSCHVSDAIKDFCTKNSIQVLTHHDPDNQVILRDDQVAASEFAGFKCVWAARYVGHVRCQGILAMRGYFATFKK